MTLVKFSIPLMDRIYTLSSTTRKILLSSSSSTEKILSSWKVQITQVILSKQAVCSSSPMIVLQTIWVTDCRSNGSLVSIVNLFKYVLLPVKKWQNVGRSWRLRLYLWHKIQYLCVECYVFRCGGSLVSALITCMYHFITNQRISLAKYWLMKWLAVFL